MHRLALILLLLVAPAARGFDGAVFVPPTGHHNAVQAGADPTGSRDSAPAIQAKLNMLAIGETLDLPPGYYRCDAPLVIPSGVALAGTWRGFAGAMVKSGITDLTKYGTVLVNNVATAATAATDPCFVTLNAYSGLVGVVIFDAKQGLPGTTAVNRAFQVGTNYGTAAAGYQGADSPVIKQVTILNGWQGVRLWGCFRFVCEDVLVSANRAGFDLDCVFDTSRMDRCHVIPTYWCNADSSVPAAIQADLLGNLVAYRFGRADSVLVSQSMVYLAATGMLFNQSSNPVNPNAPWVRVVQCDLDVCNIGVDLQDSALQNVTFTAVGITTPGQGTGHPDDIGVRVGANAGKYAFLGGSIQSQSANEVRIAGGRGRFVGVDFDSLGAGATSTNPVVALTAGSVTIGTSDFPENRTQVANSGTGKAILSGSLTNAGVNTSGTVTTSGNN